WSDIRLNLQSCRLRLKWCCSAAARRTRTADTASARRPFVPRPGEVPRFLCSRCRRRKSNRSAFLESDRIRSIEPPEHGHLLTITKFIEQAMRGQNVSDVRRTCSEFQTACSEFYKIRNCGVRVLAARPLRVREG